MCLRTQHDLRSCGGMCSAIAFLGPANLLHAAFVAHREPVQLAAFFPQGENLMNNVSCDATCPAVHESLLHPECLPAERSRSTTEAVNDDGVFRRVRLHGRKRTDAEGRCGTRLLCDIADERVRQVSRRGQFKRMGSAAMAWHCRGSVKPPHEGGRGDVSQSCCCRRSRNGYACP